MGGCVCVQTEVEQLKWGENVQLTFHDEKLTAPKPKAFLFAEYPHPYVTPEDSSSCESESDEGTSILERYCFEKKVDLIIDSWVRREFGDIIKKNSKSESTTTTMMIIKNLTSMSTRTMIFQYSINVNYTDLEWSSLIHHLKFQVLCSSVSSDGKYLFLSSPHFIYHLNIETRKMVGKFRPRSDVFHDSDDAAVTAGIIRRRKKSSKRLMSCEVTCMDYHRGLIAGGGSECPRIWDAHSYELLMCLRSESNRDQITSIEFNRRGSMMITGAVDNTVCLWSIIEGRCLKTIRDHIDHVTCSMFTLLVPKKSEYYDNNSEEKAHFLTCSIDGAVYVYSDDDDANGDGGQSTMLKKTVRTLELSKGNPNYSHVYQSKLNCDSTMLACLTAFRKPLIIKEEYLDCNLIGNATLMNGDGKIIVLKWPEMTIIRVFDVNASTVEFHPLLPHIMAVADKTDECLKILDIRNGQCLKSKSRPFLSDIHFTPDGSRVIYGCFLWDVSDCLKV